ncbi:OmpA family protein [Spirosoma sp. KNUC1025]|uniref:OmpA family protein n=1 Tax=Spirosoma sp. KNUC1025 TaxID=2894082 RepID=UPI00386F4085|nr:OmpA family protein [Spirosoma sp. KNUC1025]
MNWKKNVVLIGVLLIIRLTPSISQVQPQQRFTPVDRTSSVVSVEGNVQDAATKKPVVAATVIAKNQDGKIRAQQLTSADGSFLLKVDRNQTYNLIVQANGYDAHDKLLSFTSANTDRVYGIIVPLYQTGTKPASTTTATAGPIHQTTSGVTSVTSTEVNLPTATVSAPSSPGSRADVANARVAPPKTLDAKVVYTPPLVVAPVGKTTQLRAIQFVQSKAELLPDAMPALEQLLAFMQSKPTAEIELSGHTDNQGDFDQNLRLSKERVDVVKAYLVQNGIVASRITTRGYGPTRPIASNNSETTRKLNRRVEMIVVKE